MWLKKLERDIILCSTLAQQFSLGYVCDSEKLTTHALELLFVIPRKADFMSSVKLTFLFLKPPDVCFVRECLFP